MIRIQKAKIIGLIDLDITVKDMNELEVVRTQILEAYKIPECNGEFTLDFTLQTDNFSDIQYFKHKKK